MAVLTINFPNLAEDAELDIPPHGLFQNGHAYEVPGLEEDQLLGEEPDEAFEVEEYPRNVAARERAALKESDEMPEPDDVPTTGAPTVPELVPNNDNSGVSSDADDDDTEVNDAG